MSEITLEVNEREQLGKNNSRRLRATGEVPAVVYGGAYEPVAIRVSERTVRDLVKRAGDNAVFLLQLAGTDERRHAMIRALQYDPLTDRMLHIDFQRIDLSRAVRVRVAIELVGVPVGVKTDGGLLDFVTREVEVECLPTEIPARLSIDVSELRIGQHLEAGQLQLPSGVTLVEEPNRVLASVAVSRATLEAETPEGEEAALIESEQKEPEVLSRGKSEETEE